MRETLTVSLPKELRRGLEKMKAREPEGVTAVSQIRRAIKSGYFPTNVRDPLSELLDRYESDSKTITK